MSIQLNHTIVRTENKRESAAFLAEVLGLPEPEPFSHFLVVKTENGVSLDYMETSEPIRPQHYAFLVSESELDAIFNRIKRRGLTYWADPMSNREGEINTRDGGRGLYFKDPSGHHLEIAL
jgi:catechol 2,3-dioxygenase-like lactoylglutathione lyase family enzyme